MNELFPIFVKANQIEILLVGGGNVAREKLHFLLKSSPNARITVVAKEVERDTLNIVKEHTSVSLYNRAYDPVDLEGKQLVIVAANNAELNKQIRLQTQSENVLLNVADKPEWCDFYLGGIVTKGDLKLAISTNGKAPIMARRLREFFEQELPNNLDDLLVNLNRLRKKLNGNFNEKLHQLNELTKKIIET